MSSDALSAFMAKVDAHKQQMIEQTADDLTSVANLVGAMGQSFSTTIYAFQQVSILKSDLDLVRSVTPAEGSRALFAARVFKRHVKTLRSRYKMANTAELFETAGSLAADLEGEALEQLLKTMAEYCSYLTRAVRTQIPFYELSTTFEGVRAASSWVEANPSS